MNLVQLEDVKEAAKLLEGVVLRTPLEPSWALSEQAGGTTYLKCENLQRTGAFKIRGAYNFISRLSDEQKRKGVVAASAGNHGQGVALAASLLGVKATVFMPIGAALPKIEAVAHYGAEVILEGSVWDDSQAAAVEFSKARGTVLVHPFDHPHVIAGQGTVALEILEQLPTVSTILVPVGGGGLISGIAAAAKGLSPGTRVIGVEPEGAATVAKSLEFGRLVSLDQLKTVADGLAAKRSGPIAFAHVEQLVDEVVLVSDDEIAQALLLIAERAKLVVEPSGAAAVAALMTHKAKVEFPAVAVLSGGNIDPMFMMQVIRFGMSSAGRYFSFRTRLVDRPGELHRLLGAIAEEGANIVGIEHRREGPQVKHLGEVEVVIEVEARGPDEMRRLERRLAQDGYAIERI